MNQHTKSILEMNNGAFLEVTDYEVSKIINNIRDVNTDPKAKRAINIKIIFQPDADRQNVAIDFKVDSKLAPVNPSITMLYISGEDNDGIPIVAEMTPQLPGQIGLDGSEQCSPPMLKLV